MTFRNGKKAEITNTDAEGRVVLADAIARAAEDRPDVLLETSTLTGAQLVALGSGPPASWAARSCATPSSPPASARGEGMWPMPLPAELRRGLDSPVADFVNSTAERLGGMLVGGHFLAEFVPDGLPWAHIDIAGPSYNTGAPWGYNAQGRHRRPRAHPARDHRGPHRRLTPADDQVILIIAGPPRHGRP